MKTSIIYYFLNKTIQGLSNIFSRCTFFRGIYKIPWAEFFVYRCFLNKNGDYKNLTILDLCEYFAQHFKSFC